MLSGTDVVGDVCGSANEAITIDGVAVPKSGKNLEKAKFLHIDLVKTATIIAQLAGDSASSSITDLINRVGASFSGSAREYCLSTVNSSRLHSQHVDLTTIALTPDMDEETRSRVSHISKKLQTEAECQRSVRLKRSLGTARKFTFNEPSVEIEKEKMRGILLSARLCQNRENRTAKLLQGAEAEEEESKWERDGELGETRSNSSLILVTLEPEGKMRVWRTSSLSTDDAESLMSLNPAEVALTGGGACRYCVEQCQEG